MNTHKASRNRMPILHCGCNDEKALTLGRWAFNDSGDRIASRNVGDS